MLFTGWSLSPMPRFPILFLAASILAGCQQTAPIYSPPPGGHDALSQPPRALVTQSPTPAP